MNMNTTYNYEKFIEWLLLKKYSPATAATTARATEYFRQWAAGEGITELETIRYPDAMVFIAWSSRQGASQKTIANYLTHISKYYQFLISESMVKENPVAHIKIQGIKRKVYHDILNTDELKLLYNQYPTTIEQQPGWPPQERNILSRKRNKVILSLLIYQGLRAEELASLELHDLQLREGKITIHSQRRTAGRTMRLESHQVYELMDYIHEIRKQFLNANETRNKLFLQWKAADNFHSITQMLLKHLRQINPRVKNLDQLRASVITAWLKQYDLRKVQYLSGHKYVSSTEAYKVNNIDELQDDVIKFHPL